MSDTPPLHTRPFLARWPVLLITGVAMFGLHVALFLLRGEVGGQLLDFQLTGADAMQLVERLSPQQTAAHLWISGVVDMAYPLSYGGFVAGLCLRYGGPRGWLYASAMLLAAGLDVAENLVQVAGLSGYPDLLQAKTLLTPAKFLFVAIGSGLAIWLWGRAVFKR